MIERLKLLMPVAAIALASVWRLTALAQELVDPTAPSKVSPPPVQSQQTAGAANEPQYLGADSCGNCHEANPKRRPVDGLKYYTLSEMTTWSEQDKHSMAFAALSGTNATSAQIGRLLGIDPQRDDRCLSCHAVVCDPKLYQPAVVESLTKDGVSCEVCHGPAEKWRGIHDIPKTWRYSRSRAERVAAGMTDLRDPLVRAEKCLSCHLGNRKEGKFVTHEMFAAGHPPVSGFEVETFLTSMPPHWDRLKPLPPEYASQYPDRDVKPGSMYSTRMVAIGGLAALRSYAELLRDDARERLKQPTSGSAELALYDCEACHHELATPSWRQKRGYQGRAPGRPRMRPWPLVLARLHAAATDDGLSAELKSLYDALASAPFGDPVKIASSADVLVKKASAGLKTLSNEKFDRRRGEAMAKRICEIGMTESVDFESARQLGWALKIVCDDLWPSAEKHTQIEAVPKPLVEELALDLPVGKSSTYEASLAQLPSLRLKYDPEKLQTQLKEIAQLLDGKAER